MRRKSKSEAGAHSGTITHVQAALPGALLVTSLLFTCGFCSICRVFICLDDHQPAPSRSCATSLPQSWQTRDKSRCPSKASVGAEAGMVTKVTKDHQLMGAWPVWSHHLLPWSSQAPVCFAEKVSFEVTQ